MPVRTLTFTFAKQKMTLHCLKPTESYIMFRMFMMFDSARDDWYFRILAPKLVFVYHVIC